ncbi:hypothetical protein B0J14DRAFT_669496 [Halenospora varia]|nr:hypothetical protein B0J14DRAFT_669496 [Halenospora varia]
MTTRPSEIPPSLLAYLLHEKTDDSTLQPSILKVNIIFIVVIIVATSLRLFMVLALLSSLLLSTACLIGESYGLGKHIWNLSSNPQDLPSNVGRITKALYGCYLAYSTSITFTKLSIMATYIRIFPNGLLRYSIYVIGFVVVVFWITSIFAIIFTCVPVQAAWDYTITNARCIHIVDYFYTSAGVNIATDLLLCFLPLPTIWSLQMPKAQRVVVCFLFAMGSFACVASMLRLSQLYHLTSIDVPYQTIGSLNWSVIEVGTAIVCTSVASLRPLAARYLPSIFSHFSQHNSDMLSLHLDTTSASTSKVLPQSQISRVKSMREMREGEGGIYVQRAFDLTELDVLSRERGKEEGIGTGKKWKQSEATTAWTEVSRRSSQRVLVRDPGVGIAK